MGCKRVTIFFILTHLRHDWDTGTVAPKVHKRCTRGAREVHERCTRGAREGHERGRRGAFLGTKGDTVFFILTRLGHGWDTVGTRGHWRHRCTRGAREGHERCTRGAREGHKRGTRGAREGHERCTRGASLNFPTTHNLVEFVGCFGSQMGILSTINFYLGHYMCFMPMHHIKKVSYKNIEICSF